MPRISVAFLILVVAASPLRSESKKLDKAVKKAYQKLDDGKPEEAVEELTKATRDVGTPAWLALARLNERLGRFDAAADAYEEAARHARPALRAQTLASRASFTLRFGTGLEALTLADIAVEAGETATTLAVRARAQVRTGDGAGALDTAEKAVLLDSTSALAHVARGEALMAVGRNADAGVALEKATELDPSSALAHARLARALIALARPREAVAAGRIATERDPTFGEGFAVLGAAILAENLENWGQAIAEAQQGAFLEERNPVVLTTVGRILTVGGRSEQAVGALERALAADPGFAPARLALVKTELDRGNREVALALAREGAVEATASPEIRLLIGEDALRHEDYVTALGILEKAIEGLPGNADAWALLGRAYQSNGRFVDAAQAYERAVELAPQQLDYRTTYGLLLGMTGDLAGGLENLEAVVRAPGYEKADAWANLGWTHRRMHEPEASISAYRRALEIDAELAQAHLGLGWAHHQTESYDEAIAAYHRAAQLDPELEGDAYNGIAWSYVYEGDADNARESQSRSIAAGREDPRLGKFITMIEEAVRDRAENLERLKEERDRETARLRKLNDAFAGIRSEDPDQRAGATRSLARHGGAEDGVVEVLIYLLRKDPSYRVRIAATETLGSLGHGAREAIPHLDALIQRGPIPPDIANPSPERLELEALDGDFHQAMRDALARIRGW